MDARLPLLVILLSTVVLSGCGNFFSVFRSTDLTAHSVAIDAEQRLVISGGAASQRVICAEPSPDVLKVRGGSLSALLDRAEQGNLEVALAASEAGQNIGLRTQSIQLLRDAMYRVCEGMLAGKVGDRDFVDLQTRFQKLTAVLLATEQLTGAVQPRPTPIVAISAGASTGSGVLQLQEQVEAARKAEDEEKKSNESLKSAHATLNGEVTAAQTARADAETAKKTAEGANDQEEVAKQQKIIDAQTQLLSTQEPKLEKAAEELAASDQRLAERTANRASLERLRDAASSASVNTTPFGAQFETLASRQPLDSKSVQFISKAVEGMVSSVFAQDNAEMVCLRDSLEQAKKRERLAALDLEINTLKSAVSGRSASEQDKLKLQRLSDQKDDTKKALSALDSQGRKDYCEKVFELAKLRLASGGP